MSGSVGRRIFADADHRGNPTKRRLKDIEFLEKVMKHRSNGDLDALKLMRAQHIEAPQWKRIALDRAISVVIKRIHGIP